MLKEKNESLDCLMSLKKYIDSLNQEQREKRFGKRFLEYLITENGRANIENIFWYIQAVNQNIKMRGRGLDLGCGFGLHSILLKELNPEISAIMGLDPDQEKINVFEKILEELNIHNVKADIGVGENLPFSGEKFDFIYCNESLSHVNQVERVLSEINRVLKKGGKIIVSDTKKWNPYALWFVYCQGHKEEKYFSQNQMKRLLIKHQFKKIKRIKGIVAPRNPLRNHSQKIWWFIKFIDPKYMLVGEK